jgi:leucyl-tRNA synthetase
MPVDLYVGGSEHAVLHLLYARFWHKVLYDLGLVKHDEPFTKLVHQGMILGEDGQKMAKSRGNVINPDDVVRAFGADAFRLYEMFMGPLEQMKPWQTSGIEGVRRFLDRVWALSTERAMGGELGHDTKKLLHKTIKKVGDDIEHLRFNTAISAMMILVKHLGTLDPVPVEAVRALSLIVAPFAPHVAEEIWQRLGHAHSLAREPWPAFDPELVKDDVIAIGVQINGKVRSAVELPIAADEASAKALASSDPKMKALLEGKTVKKVIYVPGKILNFIVS